MEVTARELIPDNQEIKEAQKLYHRAFPIEERIEDGQLLALMRQGSAKLLAIDALEDGQTYAGAGYAYIILGAEGVGYLLFFAIDDSWRGKGLGGGFLRLLSESDICSQIVLDIENTIVEDAPNMEERLRRKQFYLERGFRETPYRLLYEGGIYEVLCTDDAVNMTGYQEIIRELGRLGSEIIIL